MGGVSTGAQIDTAQAIHERLRSKKHGGGVSGERLCSNRHSRDDRQAVEQVSDMAIDTAAGNSVTTLIQN